MRTRWIQKRSLFTTNVKAVGDTCVTAARGANQYDQSEPAEAGSVCLA